MSDISILSKHYDDISELSTKLNDAILVLKKDERQPGTFPDTSGKRISPKVQVAEKAAHEREQARDFIRSFLDELISILSQRFSIETSIPYSLVDGFEKLSSTEPYFDQELRSLRQRLTTQQTLTQENFDLLDKILSVIDSDVSAAFRKLWRRR